MTASGIICGNCGETVDEADIICPYCDALLAAYASPSGAVTATPAYTPPSYAAPPPAAVLEITTAPTPLFDTHVTIEELMESADSDSPMELLLADALTPATEIVPAAPAPKLKPASPRPVAEPKETRVPPPVKPSPVRPSAATERGETEAYLRKLHKQAGYKADASSLSKPVQTRSQTRDDREANRESREAARHRTQSRATQPGRTPPPIMKWIVGLLWVLLVTSAVFGDFSFPLFALTLFLTWGMRNGVLFGKGRR